jgi:putative transposase
LSDHQLGRLIEDIQDEFAGYGYRRVTRELRARGNPINHKRVQRIMKANDLGIKPRRRFVKTMDSDHALPLFPNLYGNLISAKPDVVWVADITYVRIRNGFVYLAVVLDACSRKVVGWAISSQIDSELTLAALEAAARSRHRHQAAAFTIATWVVSSRILATSTSLSAANTVAWC